MSYERFSVMTCDICGADEKCEGDGEFGKWDRVFVAYSSSSILKDERQAIDICPRCAKKESPKVVQALGRAYAACRGTKEKK